MKIEEAKKKWCPFARVWLTNMDGRITGSIHKVCYLNRQCASQINVCCGNGTEHVKIMDSVGGLRFNKLPAILCRIQRAQNPIPLNLIDNFSGIFNNETTNCIKGFWLLKFFDVLCQIKKGF